MINATVDFVAIPAGVFESQEYKALSYGNREFLLRLYHLFGDCITFALDYKTPEEYGERHGAAMHGKLQSLLKCGLVEIESKPAGESRGPRPRVLRFRYSIVEAYQ
jgi:hypothetical protein